MPKRAKSGSPFPNGKGSSLQKPARSRNGNKAAKTRAAREAKTAKAAAFQTDPAAGEVPTRSSAKAREVNERARNQALAAVARLAATNHTAVEIAAKLNMPQQTVYVYLNRLDPYFSEVASQQVKQMRGRQALIIDHLLKETLDGLTASKAVRKTRTVEALRLAPGKGGKAEKTSSVGKVRDRSEERHADVNFIFAANGLLGRQAKLFGLDAPIQLSAIIEERTHGLKAMMEAAKKHIKDPDALEAFAREILSLEDSNDGAALTGEEDDEGEGEP